MVKSTMKFYSNRKEQNQGSRTCLFPISLLTGLASVVKPAFWFRNTPFSPLTRGLVTLPGTFLLGEASESAETSNWRALQDKKKRMFVSNKWWSNLFAASLHQSSTTLCCVNSRPCLLLCNQKSEIQIWTRGSSKRMKISEYEPRNCLYV